MDGYGYSRQPQRMQGQGFYNPYMKGPDWGAGIAQFLQKLQMEKQMGQQQEQREWQRGMQERQMGLTEQNILSQIETRKPKPAEPIPSELISMAAKAVGMTPEELMKLPPGRRNEIYIKALTKMFQKPTKPEPTLEEKVTERKALVTAGEEARAPFKAPPKVEETPAERDARIRREAMIRGEVAQTFKVQPTPAEVAQTGATTRRAIDRQTASFYDKVEIKIKDLQRAVEGSRGKPPISDEGYRLDMPRQYVNAVLYKRNGVATPGHENIINKYEGWFDYFLMITGRKPVGDAEKAELIKRGLMFSSETNLLLSPIYTFKEWMKSAEPDNTKVNINQIKEWYEIYKRFLKDVEEGRTQPQAIQSPQPQQPIQQPQQIQQAPIQQPRPTQPPAQSITPPPPPPSQRQNNTLMSEPILGQESIPIPLDRIISQSTGEDIETRFLKEGIKIDYFYAKGRQFARINDKGVILWYEIID